MADTTVLLVEDNKKLNIANKDMLELLGFNVTIAVCLAEARQAVASQLPDIIVLDIRLPDGNGLDFLRELREAEATAHIPVIMLTTLGTLDDRVSGLSSGADDYLAKPYEYKELAARIEALLRRAKRLPQVLTKGLLKLDVVSGQAFCGGENLLLTQKDFALLLLFIQNEDKAMSAEYLYEKVWKSPLNEDSQAIKSALSRLRKKLSGSGYTIFSQRYEGYIFERE